MEKASNCLRFDCLASRSGLSTTYPMSNSGMKKGNSRSSTTLELYRAYPREQGLGTMLSPPDTP